ncbi:MAG: hydroxylamine reductase [Capsulimonadaceae bacterium]|nr:hydroxylamine reductase [Capsulimonadaceae bacterium]
MFCYQCEQTKLGKGCFDIGNCGKDAQTAALQDLLIHQLKGIGMYAHRARLFGASDRKIDRFVVDATFATLTNVNFDPARFIALVEQASSVRDDARTLYENAARRSGHEPEKLSGPAAYKAPIDLAGMVNEGETFSILARRERLDQDAAATQELLVYGLKGLAAYVDHALVQGVEDDEIYAFFHEALDFLTHADVALGDVLGKCLKVGEVNLRAMELLDGAHTSLLGHPVPTQVRIHPLKGKAILISGHDLADLKALLEQTAGTGINVYTHGEMLPGHGYPALKAFPHLAGNYGGAWQIQSREFDEFPGPILVTTNCIQKPRETYKNRLFTCGQVGWPGAQHITNRNFKPLIDAALAAPGFAEDGPGDTITVGFGHNAVLGVADKVIDAVKAGAIKRFFLIGGCDGAKPGRDYYAELADSVPDDCVILTLACGKYRFNKHEFGTIGGLPRLLDIGQCNDAYSAIKIAVALAGAFDCSVNDLPLSLVLSWYEQKAVAILLTLLHLGIKNIRIGPSLPAFISPGVLNILVENFQLTPITTAKQDLATILAGK